MGNREDQLGQVLEEARNCGLRVQFDSGLLLVKRKSGTYDRDKQSETIRKMGRYVADLRRLAEKRAIAARGKEFIGERIWMANSEGRLVDVSEDGTLSVRVSREIRRVQDEESQSSQVSMTANSENVLIIVNDDDAPVPADEEPVSEPPRKRLFGLL